MVKNATKTRRNRKRKTQGNQQTQEQFDLLATLKLWWEPSGLTPSYPVSVLTAERILQANEYDVTAAKIRYLLVTEQVTSSSEGFTPSEFLRLIQACESKRLWSPGRNRHSRKKSIFQEAREDLRKEDKAAYNADLVRLCRYSIRDLALLLLQQDHRPTRELVFTAIEMRLDAEGMEI